MRPFPVTALLVVGTFLPAGWRLAPSASPLRFRHHRTDLGLTAVISPSRAAVER